MAASISASVGKNGKNLPKDVQVVQMLLGRHAAEAGYRKPKPSGEMDADTLKAIEAFQKAAGLKKVDGRVDTNGDTLKALNASALPAAAAAAPVKPVKPGKLSGKTSGPQKDIVDFVEAVAAFYGRDIRVSDGKRLASEQGPTMFKYWTENLQRGLLYSYLKSNSKIQKELDALYVTAVEDKTQSGKEKKDAQAAFEKRCNELATKLSLHVQGRAIDIAPKSCMTPAMRAAMRTGLHEIEEKSCLHYDLKDGTAPAVTDTLKKKWKAP